MKKIFPIILYVLLGIIILPILYLVFVSLLDTFYEAGGDLDSGFNIYISMALSITLSIIIPIRRYKRAKANKNKKSVGIKFRDILIFVLWWGFWAVLPTAIFLSFLPLLNDIFGLGVTIIFCITWFVVGFIVIMDPKAVEKYNKAKKKETLL